jgi:hypothetical protein
MPTNESIKFAECLLNDAHLPELLQPALDAPSFRERNIGSIPETEQSATQCLLSFVGFSHGQTELAVSKILEIVAKSFGSPIAVLWVPDSDAVALRRKRFWTENNPISTDLVEKLSQIELWPVEALPGRVWAQGRGEVLHEVASDGHLARTTLFPKSGIRSAFAIPAKADSETLCVLELLSREPFAFKSVSPLQMNTLSEALGILFRRAPLTL